LKPGIECFFPQDWSQLLVEEVEKLSIMGDKTGLLEEKSLTNLEN
jgi:hypothetical protein